MSRYLKLSLPRRFICDLMHASQKVPTVPMQRHMLLDELVTARLKLKDRPSWCAIFTKALAIVKHRTQLSRWCYLNNSPFPRLYKNRTITASVAIAKYYGDERAVFFTQIREPYAQSLKRIDWHFKMCQALAVENHPLFRRALFVSRFPRPIRRLLWWWGLNTSGPRREKYFGTYGVSVTAQNGASALHQLSPLSLALNYGVISEFGEVDVRLVYDHRVWDGLFITILLRELESVLCNEILNELKNMEREHDHLPAGRRRSNVAVLFRPQANAQGQLEERRRDAAKPLEGSSARPRPDET